MTTHTKIHLAFRSSVRPAGGLALGLAVLSFFGGTEFTQAGFDLGDAANYAVLYEGSGGHNLQINSSPLAGSTILGNIGLGDENGGNPQAQLNNPAVITGNVNFAGSINYNGNAVVHGTTNGGVTAVETDLNYLNGLSSTLGAEAGAALTISLSGSGGSQTINASSGDLDATGNRVFNLTSMTFNSGNTLTINGDGAGDSVVINVAESNINNPHFSGAINLTGGLTPNQVLFNITGGNSVMLTGGSTLQTSANNATQDATYLDPNGTITMNSVNIDGHVFGGDSSDMQIVSGATIVAAVPEPQPLALVALGLVGLLVKRRGTRAVPLISKVP
jgi:choice-of-anchor A domain-containing protein